MSVKILLAVLQLREQVARQIHEIKVMELEHYVDGCVLCASSHDSHTCQHCDCIYKLNHQRLLLTTQSNCRQIFLSPEFGTKFQGEVLLFLEIPEFPYNTV